MREAKEIIKKLKNISINSNGMYIEEIEEIEEMLCDEAFKLAIIGEFSSGKSTFINSIIGKRILYSSVKEATGVVTKIENGSKKIAEIYFENDRYEKINLNGENSYIELCGYLDKNRIGEKISGVNINYPLDGIDKDVILLDTPGLQGISDRELLITKEALKTANATIVLINHKGLSDTELKLLQGNLEKFGRIKTKEVILVISKIGELYEGVTKEEGDIKLTRSINEVKETLKKNEVDNIKVFGVDSRDYLWGRDEKLYNEVLEKNDNNIATVLSQQDYIERSKFLELKQYLEEFLSEDNRSKAFYDDIKEKMLLLIEGFKEALRNDHQNYGEIQGILNKIEIQKELISKNKRGVRNSVLRQLEDSLSIFRENIKGDIEFDKKDNEKELVKVIKERVRRVEDVSNLTNKIVVDKVNDEVKLNVEKYSSTVNKYKNKISSLLDETFNNEFSRILSKREKIKFNISTEPIEINLKFKGEVKEENKVKEIETMIQENKDELKRKNIELSGLDESLSREETVIENEIRRKRIERDREISLFGSKPLPKQKYRYETRVKRKWIFFSKEYEVKVPDGVDYSEVKDWEGKCENVRKKYLDIENKLYKKLDVINEGKRRKEKLYLEVKNIEGQINMLLTDKELIEKMVDKLKKERSSMYLEQSKERLFISYKNVIGNHYKRLMGQLNEDLDRFGEKVKKEVDKQSIIYINGLDKELESQYNKTVAQMESLKAMEDTSVEELEELQREIIKG